MNQVYPVILSMGESYIIVYVPDFDIMTQGVDLADAIMMARDIICLTAVTLEDAGKPIPKPSSPDSVQNPDGGFLTLVDVDPAAYRAMLDNRSVRKNCTLPSWLNAKAEKANINFSQILQEALIERLGLSDKKGA